MTRSATGASEAPNDVAEQPAPHRPDFDAATEAARISDALREAVLRTLKRRGLIVGLSGGVDSTVTAALGAAALGKGRVLGVLMPERDSDPDSLRLGRLAAESLGIECVLEDIGSALDATGCYDRRDAFIRQIVPSYGPGWRCKIGLSEETSGSGFGVSYLIVENPSGERARHRMTAEVYRGVIAAANMKQRIRKQIEYYHADRLGYAVAGTPNRLEYDQGFFVKNGDGAADVKPIAHLYKTQVYHLAQFFGAPEEIRLRPPTTDTWPLAQSQEEFYFLAPYQIMDICLDGLNRGLTADETAKSAGIEPERVHLLWRDIQAKRKATSYLHQPPILCG